MLSVHTSPLDQPGSGDAGGMNVYIAEVARRLAWAGVEVEIFTRAGSRDLPPRMELDSGVQVRHVLAWPNERPVKDLPVRLRAFADAIMLARREQAPVFYDLLHSHHWLAGQAGWLVRARSGVPLVHTPHSLAKVKNARLAKDDRPEPRVRIRGEERVAAAADRLVANTATEAAELVQLYRADAAKVSVVEPGVDLDRFAAAAPEAEAAGRVSARHRLGLATHGHVVAFVGRLQPRKAPDLLVRVVAWLRKACPDTSATLTAVIAGGPSGSGLDRPASLRELASRLGVSDAVRFLPPLGGDDLPSLYHAADLVVVPSHSESFGLVALEAQACGTPVVAAAVGGLTTAVRDGVSGVLVDGHAVADWARVLRLLLAEPGRRLVLSRGAVAHARTFSWERTAERLLEVYSEAVWSHHAARAS